MVNIQSKEVLARLLAQENLTVVHQNVQTASFNLKDRVLTLPMWNDMENYTYDHLVGHEVAHALYTPEEKWLEAVKAEGDGFHGFLNVVEDARIEKLIQRRYPGLRKQFIKSYKKLLADGFFGKSEDEINSFKLIDRLNVYFKCGLTTGVQFDKDEKAWIKEIEDAETFEEVLDIAKRLFGKAIEEHNEEQEAMAKAMDEMLVEEGEDELDGEYGDGDFQDFETDFDAEDGFEASGDDEETDSKEDDQTQVENSDAAGDEASDEVDPSQSKKFGHEGGEGGPESVTEKALSENIAKEFGGDPNVKFRNLHLNLTPKITLDRVVGHKEILSCFEGNQVALEAGEHYMKQFMVNNKKTINYLVKEFEMKKKAAEYKRASVSKTGVIDTLKMNNYMFQDDIFKKMTVIPEGKNHGLQMFIDWSGSMSDQLHHTVDQLINLVMFCKQVNIPFEVYAFTDRWDVSSVRNFEFQEHKVFSKHELAYQPDFRLMELFTNKMSRSDFTMMTKAIMAVANYWQTRWLSHRPGWTGPSYYSIPNEMWLGGTPLDESIVASMVMHDIFKKKNRLDIVNMVFLTDGSSNIIRYLDESDWKAEQTVAVPLKISRYFTNKKNYTESIIYVNDPMTKKRYRVQPGEEPTNLLLKMLRDHTQANLIGFHILPARKPQALAELPVSYSQYQLKDKLWDELRSDKFCVIPETGYDLHFGLLGGKHLATSNGAIEVEEGVSKTKLRTAFKKANSSRKTSRVMLSKFIDMVA